MSGFSIGRARPAEAAELAQFAAACFEQSFGTNYPPQDLQAFLSAAYAVTKIAREIERQDCQMDLARSADGALVGYCFSGPLDLPVSKPEPGAYELKRIYLAPAAQGSGLADQLLARSFEAARQALAPAIYLGVWSQNPRAQAFYRKRGFEDCGAYQFPVGSVLDDELILRLAPIPAGPQTGG